MLLLRNIKQLIMPGMVVHAFHPNTGDAVAGGSLSSWPAWSTEQVLGQPRLHREPLSQKQKKKIPPLSIPFFSLYSLLLCVCMCVCALMCSCMYVRVHTCGIAHVNIRGKFGEVSSSLHSV